MIYNRKLLLYIVMTFTIPLVCICVMRIFPNCSMFFYGIEGASPTIAAIMIWSIDGGVLGLKDKLYHKYFKNFDLKYCFIAVLIPFVILTLAKSICMLIFPEQEFVYLVTSKKMLIITWALIAEELGWRGFLQDELDGHMPSFVVPVCIGVIWAFWHYHFILSGSMKIPIIAFLLGCIFESYGYYLITKLSKGNIIPASIWHFTGNLSFNLYRFDPSWNHQDTRMYWITTSVYFLNVIIFTLSYKKITKQ